MAKTFFFYDLETSGLDPRHARIMQFAGIRTTQDLKPIGKPYNILVKLSNDTLPSVEALMVTGITPQKTHEEGITEVEFANFLSQEICAPDTVMIGFNNIRFDDEFVRYHLWRNFHDPYEWSWKEGRSRWDLLDVVRMTRALRPEGIAWPTVDGKASNRLEYLTKENNIDHFKAHDALSDVEALIAVTRLIKEKQPQLFSYLFDMRNKKKIKDLVNLDHKKPFVYTSGRYKTAYNNTTVAFPLTTGKNGNVIVYDLRHDPNEVIDLNINELREKIFASSEDRKKEGFIPLAVKELQYNRSPAVAPIGVLEQYEGWNKISLNRADIEKNIKTLLSSSHFAENIRTIFENRGDFKKADNPEARLYDGFLNDYDRVRVESVRKSSEKDLLDYHPEFIDDRLEPLLLHYKARNYPNILSDDEMIKWEKWRQDYIKSQLPQFTKSMTEIMNDQKDKNQFVIEELRLWVESLMSIDE